MQKEPALTIGAISAAVASILAALVAFGVPLTDEQQVAILSVVAAVGPLVVALVTRRFVYSPDSADRAVAAALLEPAPEADDGPRHAAD